MRALVLCFGCLLFACSAPRQPNILLISIDTLRADRLGVYGFPEDTTPHIDAVARAGVRFDKVLSPIPLTLPAHSSMLTGLFPATLGMHDNLSYRLDDEHTTLAEILAREGYTTGAVVSSFVLDAQFNVAQGFESYDDDFEEEHKIAFLSERAAGETTDRALAWLETLEGDAPFFLFLHYYDPHDDYRPPEPFASRLAPDAYAGEIAFVDDNIGRLLRALRARGLEDDTLIVITADHGEMLGEHGELTHGYFVYQSALEVPLIVKGPGIEPGVVEEWVSLIDVTPTIAGLVGAPIPPRLDGSDLSPTLRDGAPAPRGRDLYAESLTPNRYYGVNPLFALVSGDLKYIHTTRPELYDLRNDPGESSNLVEERLGAAEVMKSKLEAVLAHAAGDASEASLDAESLSRLSSLGYLSGGSPPKTLSLSLSLEDNLDDPKDWIAFYRDHQTLEALVNDESYAEARALAEAMLRSKPGFVAGYLQLARIATATGAVEEATGYYLEALARDPGNATAHFNVANLFAGLGRMDEAATHYRKALEADPGLERARERLARIAEEPVSPAAQHFRLGLEARQRGDVEIAIGELRRAVGLDPDSAEAHNALGVTLKNAGRADEALEHYRRAIQIEPDFAAAHNNVGSLLASQGELGAAIDHFRQAVASDRANAEAHNNLALALRMTGARDEAIPHFRAALSERADWPRPMSELAWILATHPNPGRRDPARALELATRAVELTSGREPVILDTLAASQAASGNYAEAVRTAEKAIALAAVRAPGLAREIEARLAGYRAGRAYVEPERVRAAPGPSR